MDWIIILVLCNFLTGYQPFRRGKEFWVCIELLRVLLLTSMMGFVSIHCAMKELAALLVSMVFLLIFVTAHPHRQRTHHIMQIAAICVPIVSMPVNMLQNSFSD